MFGAPRIEEAEIEEVVAALRSGWIGTGPRVARFEADFAAYKGVPAERVAALNSCTAALHVSLVAAGIGPGDEVVTTPLTFAATVNAVIHAGATPVLVDVDPATRNLDPGKIEARITSRTRAILPVHFAGKACDMDPILALARRYELRVIEDCAHAIETECGGRKAGTLGDFGCFSFYATKNATTAEGGMVVARVPEEIARVKVLSLHGMSKDAWHRHADGGFVHYDVVECGFKYNMTDLQAALGIHQLARVDRCWERRLAVWRAYDAAFADLPLTLPPGTSAESRHGLHLYTVLVDPARAGLERDEFLTRMDAEGIGTGVNYRSVAEHPYYQKRFGWVPDDWPHAARIGRQTASLPLSAALTDEDVEDVIAAVRRVLGA